MTVLSETVPLILEHDRESTWLKIKSTDEVLFEDCCYGEPGCGLINSDNVIW